MYALGLPERYPLKLGGSHVQYQAGNNAAMATLFAWHGQRYEGMGGQRVDVSILETQMASINGRLTSLVNYQYNGERGAAARAEHPWRLSPGPLPLQGRVHLRLRRRPAMAPDCRGSGNAGASGRHPLRSSLRPAEHGGQGGVREGHLAPVAHVPDKAASGGGVPGAGPAHRREQHH